MNITWHLRDDPPIIPTVNMLMMLYNDLHNIAIWTGRSDIAKDITLDWLEKYAIRPIYSEAPDSLTSGILPTVELRMRRHKDNTPDHKLKREWLNDVHWKPDIIFEDRQRVVDMWRGQGLLCYQVDVGNF